MEYLVLVDVQLRDGIADPAGTTVERSLPALGYRGISGVRVGKTVRFQIEAVDEKEALAVAEDLSTTFLANPVIEDAVVTVGPVEVV